MITTPTPETLTLADAARRYGVSYSRLHHQAMRLRLNPVQTVGERKLYAAGDVERLLPLIVELDARRVVSMRPRRRAAQPFAE